MRILVLTNFYPPYELGGQEQSCEDVVGGLKRRGHHLVVLTSMHGTHNLPVEADGIFRWLYLEMELATPGHSIRFFTERKRRERHNLDCLQRVVEQTGPDAVFIWGMWNLPRSLPALAEALCPGRVVYRFGDYWPTLPSQHVFYWHTAGRSWLACLAKRLLSAVALAMMARDGALPRLKFEHTICISAALRDTLVECGIPVSDARIIHNGIDVEPYLQCRQHQATPREDRPLKLLYAGRLAPEKGVDTAIKAMAGVVFGRRLGDVRLSIVGSGTPDYEDVLQQLVIEAGLTDSVAFLGRVPREAMPELLPQFDVLVFPSIWKEPFGRVLLEAMISGLVVVAAGHGAPCEIVADGENGLLFTPGDAEDLAEKIATLAGDDQTRRRLVDAGAQTVLERFTIARMLDQIENCLKDVAGFGTETVQASPGQAPVSTV
ncbi:MAG: glycosyltransferase family 4 protein [Ardenticatenaceae bacterium]|nr:glycosyltransferase family 4 protein [Ardenticatenaceae bacterium]